MEYKEFDEVFPDNILTDEEPAASDETSKKESEKRIESMERDLFYLGRKMDKIEKKLSTAKISSTDARAAKTFAKDIFRNVVEQGMDDIAARLHSVEDVIEKHVGGNSAEVASLERKVGENRQKIDGLMGITYTLAVLNFIYLIFGGIITAGKTTAGIVKALSCRRRE